MRASTARIIARAGPLGARAHTNALVAYRATVRRTVSSAMPCGTGPVPRTQRSSDTSFDPGDHQRYCPVHQSSPLRVGTRVLVALTAFSVALLTVESHGQQSRDPHLPTRSSPPPVSAFVEVEDMLLLPEQFERLFGPSRNRQQANFRVPRDPRSQWFWDFGVIPYEIAPNFSDLERQRVLSAMEEWGRTAPVTFVPRTTQTGRLLVTRDELTGNEGSPCFANVGHIFNAVARLNLGSTCSSNKGTILHELGHVLGNLHEHQRADRDGYITIDYSNVPPNLYGAFDKSSFPPLGPYDFGSIMHYWATAFALDLSRPTIIPRPQYQAEAAQMGQRLAVSENDHNLVAGLYYSQIAESAFRSPTEPTRTRFDRADMLLAMERLHSFYMSRMGLQRPQGLSIDGRPDFLGIAQWIFDIYLPARSAGFSAIGAFDIVVASITQSDEWRRKNAGRQPLTPSTFRATVNLSRDEFLDVLNLLDRFYSAPEGLQRPNGLSIAGGPDFLGIATWIFDIYLTERLNGISPNGAWTITENAIRATDEWRSKH
jgi:hypothetical protein